MWKDMGVWKREGIEYPRNLILINGFSLLSHQPFIKYADGSLSESTCLVNKLWSGQKAEKREAKDPNKPQLEN